MKNKLMFLIFILSVFVCFGCQDEDHEHTFEYIPFEETHFKQYTCGCPSPEIATMHYDNDNDGYCDACHYITKKDCEYEWVGNELGHHMVTLCDCCEAITEEYPHENKDNDTLCDVCGYDMSIE